MKVEGHDAPKEDKDDMPLALRLKELQRRRVGELDMYRKSNSASPQQQEYTSTEGNKQANAQNGHAPAKVKRDPGALVPTTNGVPSSQAKREAMFDEREAFSASERKPSLKKAKMEPEEDKPKKIAKDEKKEIVDASKPKIKAEPKDQKELKAAIKPEHKGKKKAERELDDADDDGDDDQEQEEYRWWEQQNGDKTIKWTSLEHNGLYFPPPYVPHNVPLLYRGERIELEPEAEEIATFFAALAGTEYLENEIFCKNFFEDFREILRSVQSKWCQIITELEHCDFSLISKHLEELKEKKKTLTKEEKEALKVEKNKVDELYGWCLLDGRREKVGSFRVEPPGLFRGRGKHPKAGKLKRRIMPEHVTINIGEDAVIPKAPPGHSWGGIVHDRTVTWLASWTDTINRSQKYVFLAANSSLKGQSDYRKFEVARELKKHVERIRKVNMEELRSKEMLVRQRATALWLIDRLALRAGNEKGDDEADTVGCCSLRCEHIKLEGGNHLVFDFLGKDSIRYYNKVRVDPIIYKNIGIFMRPPKSEQDPIFDRLTTSSLNRYLNGLMPGLTAKVFRTYNASHTFQQELDKTPAEGSLPERILAYNRANRHVAVLCNHQRSIPKTHQQSMTRLNERLLTLKYQRHLIRQALREMLEAKELRARLPEALEEESDMDEETVERKAQEAEEEREKKSKTGTAMATDKTDSELDQQNSPNKESPGKRPRNLSLETLEKRYHSLGVRIEAVKNQIVDRDENKTTALSTSKTNYIDPRITTSWCQLHEVPIEKLFNKSLREKFKWAMSVPKDWRF